MEQAIEKFKFKGNLYIWKYHRLSNYPGWNITFNTLMGIELVNVLTLMQSSQWPSKKAVLTTIPTEQAETPIKNQVWQTKPQLVLSFKKFAAAGHWIILSSQDSIEIQFGSSKVKELIKSIEKQLQGNNDFAISDSFENNILYFW